MKVVQAAGSLQSWGGIERYVVYLAEGLRNAGHEVHIACPPDSPIARKVKDGTHGLTASPAAIGGYLKLLKQTKAHVLHAHFSPDFVPAGIAARLAKTPLTVMSRHLAIGWNGAKLKRNLALYDHFIPVSDAVMKELRKTGIPEHRMTVAKAGVPALSPSKTREVLRNEMGIPADELAVGFFGRLAPEKGVDIIIQAARLLQGVRFHIFGDGPDRGPLTLMAQGRGVTDRVKFYGNVPDVVNQMAAMDAVAIPSTWAEAFPYSALEAMSVGVPVIASKIGGLPELIRDGVNGLLFPAGNVQQFASNCLILMADKSLGPGLGETGREIHQARYTVEQFGQRVADAYTKELHFKGLVDF
jgi:glycosyltransferase involved in cell wall biosynthesis